MAGESGYRLTLRAVRRTVMPVKKLKMKSAFNPLAAGAGSYIFDSDTTR